jgi:hypothetical protein
VIGFARQLFIRGGLGGPGKAIHEPEVAIDVLARDELGKLFARILGFGEQRLGPGLAELAPHLVVARPQIAAGNAAVAGRGLFAGALAVEDLDRPPGARQSQSRAQSAIACADDDDIAVPLQGTLG